MKNVTKNLFFSMSVFLRLRVPNNPNTMFFFFLFCYDNYIVCIKHNGNFHHGPLKSIFLSFYSNTSTITFSDFSTTITFNFKAAVLQLLNFFYF